MVPDPATFAAYTASWLQSHTNWALYTGGGPASPASPQEMTAKMGVVPPIAGAGCPAGAALMYPVCVGGVMLDAGLDDRLFSEQGGSADGPNSGGAGVGLGPPRACPKVVCYSSSAQTAGPSVACLPTPSDTLDYLPPPAPFNASSTGDAQICPTASQNTGTVNPTAVNDTDPWLLPPSYGLDSGVPPFYDPVTAPRLLLSGTVRGQTSQDTCGVVAGAIVEAWQVNSEALLPFTNATQRLSGANLLDPSGTGAFPTSPPLPSGLRGLTCRSQQVTNASGFYSFATTMPPSYGPPRHIVLRVTAPGFMPLLTRVYFANDERLLQLTTWGGPSSPGYLLNKGSSSVLRPGGTDFWGRSSAGYAAPGSDGRDAILLDSAIGRDPRVAPAVFVKTRLGTGYGPGGNMRPLGAVQGYFTVSFDVTLRSDRPSDAPDTSADTQGAASAAPPTMQLDGLWSTPSGLVKVETHGSIFLASEYPHARRWGSVVGSAVGDTVRGVDFSQPSALGLGPTGVVDRVNSAGSAGSQSTLHVDVLPMWLHQAGGSERVGVVLHQDYFTTSPNSPLPPAAAAHVSSLSLQWGGDEGTWSKQSDVEQQGYRFLKLVVSRQFATSSLQAQTRPRGTMIINEIVFYNGFVGQREVPSATVYGTKMTAPHTPQPLRVTCSSFLGQDSHCFKAFDGDASSRSAWVTGAAAGTMGSDATGTFVSNTGAPQPLWVLLDLGPGRGALPTAMRIVCDAGNVVSSASAQSDAGSSYGFAQSSGGAAAGAGPQGCPRAFTLLGSRDNGRFDVLLDTFLPEDANTAGVMSLSGAASSSGVSGGDKASSVPSAQVTAYGPQGALFHLAWETSSGRTDGQRCGSCDASPRFNCLYDGYDASCASKHCTAAGTCGPLPPCPAGQFASPSLSESGLPKATCTPCAPGRYGAIPGLVSSQCSGLCREGYFCPRGSVSATQEVCGDVAVFCPVGSGAAVSAGAGRFTVFAQVKTTGASDDAAAGMGASFDATAAVQWLSSDVGGNALRPQTRTSDQLCSLGHYCQRGLARPCPPGRYGDRPGLQTDTCADACLAGEYCPAGSITPTRCPKGSFCPDGLTRSICPAGSFGASRGLTSVRCSGLCAVGHYCPAGSTSSVQVPCPGGRYGLTAGLADAACSGACPAGWYCPPGSVNSTAHACAVQPLTPVEVPQTRFVTKVVNATLGKLLVVPVPGDPANPLYYCPVGTPAPLVADAGYYTLGGAPGYRQAQSQCERGFYCVAGVRLACPAGSYGGELGMTGTAATLAPSPEPTLARSPTLQPSPRPTRLPTPSPTYISRFPTGQPSAQPSRQPTRQPSRQPTRQPTGQPSRSPTGQPTTSPTAKARRPTGQPTRQPTRQPTSQPTRQPTSPTGQPSRRPTRQPTRQPTRRPTGQPTTQPSLRPTSHPTTSLNSSAPLPQSALNPIFCSGLCRAGHFCPLNSSSPTQVPCPPGRYGATPGLADAACTDACPMGHYCPSATVVPLQCPAGRFGNTSGLVSAECNGECLDGGCVGPALCQEGYYCPAGSVSATQVSCGSAAVYCPAGSPAPVAVSPGYFSTGPSQELHLEDAYTRTGQQLCLPGSYCAQGVMRPCPEGTFGADAGLQTAACSGPCLAGFYCPVGTINSTSLRCPAGRYGATQGLYNSACTGPCASGFHCPEGSESATEIECGVATAPARTDLAYARSPGDYSGYIGDYGTTTVTPVGATFVSRNATKAVLDAPNSVFCPLGSALPVKARVGYYTTGNTRTTRSGQQPCPPGSYCLDGVVYDCPAGRYGAASLLSSPLCTGPCAKGHYCPPASTSRTQRPCPVGRFGASSGLGDSSCSGACKRPTDCPLASVMSAPPATTVDSNVW